jgi:hypothetical protein
MTTVPNEIDFFADSQSMPVSDDQLKLVASTAQRMINHQQAIEKVEAWLKDRKEQLRTIQEVELPNAMDACGLSSFTLDSGQQILIKQICAGSIPKTKEAEAFAWLRENGHAGIIKRKIEVSLEKGKDAVGEKVVAALKKLGVEVRQSETVHSQTLGAWARELIEEGKNLPLDLLGLYVGRRATVK